MGRMKQFKNGVPHQAFKSRPTWLNSKAQWKKRGWEPQANAKPVAWTWQKNATFMLYHLRHCVPINGIAALQRRVNHELTEEEVAKMKMPLQLDFSMYLRKTKHERI